MGGRGEVRAHTPLCAQTGVDDARVGEGVEVALAIAVVRRVPQREAVAKELLSLARHAEAQRRAPLVAVEAARAPDARALRLPVVGEPQKVLVQRRVATEAELWEGAHALGVKGPKGRRERVLLERRKRRRGREERRRRGGTSGGAHCSF